MTAASPHTVTTTKFTVEDASIYIEEYSRQMIGQEELHTLELRKMLRDFEPGTTS